MSQSFYVDELATIARSVEETYALSLKAKERMKEGGFSLGECKTSDSVLAQKIASKEGHDVKAQSKVERAQETYANTTLGNHDQDKTPFTRYRMNIRTDEYSYG